MNYYHITTLRLPKIQHQQSLTLYRLSFSGWDRKRVRIVLILKGSQCLVYEWLQLITTGVTQDEQPKIVDAPWTLISRMGQWQCSILFCQGRLSLSWLWIAATRSHFNYLTYKTKNRWRSVDAHFQDGAGSLILSFLTWKAANTSFMNGCNQSPLRLPKMRSEKSLTLCWCSFS